MFDPEGEGGDNSKEDRRVFVCVRCSNRIANLKRFGRGVGSVFGASRGCRLDAHPQHFAR